VIVLRLSGGLGNQMFEYAMARHLALRNHTRLKLDLTFLRRRNTSMRHTPREYTLDMFVLEPNFFSPLERALFKLGLTRLKRHHESEFQIKPGHTVAFNPDVLTLPDNSYLEGFFPSPCYFLGIEEVIRREFVFRTPPAGAALEMQRQITDTESVCVHVRRGDYVTNPSANQTHGLCPLSYYSAAFARLQERGVRTPRLFVFSDDILWCRENLKLDAPTTYVDPEYAGEKDGDHFKLMTSCKHFIIPNSSFSWWPAWLSAATPAKVVVAPKIWTRRDIGLEPIPLGWETIETELIGG